MVNDQFVALYNEDAHHVLRLCKLDGSPDGEIPLPGPGSIVQINDMGLHRAPHADHEAVLCLWLGTLSDKRIHFYDFRTRAGGNPEFSGLDFDIPPGYGPHARYLFPARMAPSTPMYLSIRKDWH